MIVICEDCGKKYRIDPSKIVKDTVRFKCRICDHIVEVSRPDKEPTIVKPDLQTTTEIPSKAQTVSNDDTPPQKSFYDPKPAKTAKPSRWRIGLRLRMFVLFFLVPVIVFSAAGLLYLIEMQKLADLLTGQSVDIATEMAETSVTQKARAVASQCQLYLYTRGDLRPQDFNRDPEFKRLAVQRVGLRGYTALYSIPGKDRKWQTWSHVDPRIIGIDMGGLKKPMGRHFEPFWKILTGVKDGQESSGYYTWKDKDNKFREKFMVCTPVEGTPYVIAATAYVDEMISQITMLKTRSMRDNEATRKSVLAILVGTVVLIGLIVFIFGHRLTGRIKSLTDVAERISVGDLDADIPIRSNDEIGELGEAIARMQDSIRLSIERLRRRR